MPFSAIHGHPNLSLHPFTFLEKQPRLFRKTPQKQISLHRTSQRLSSVKPLLLLIAEHSNPLPWKRHYRAVEILKPFLKMFPEDHTAPTSTLHLPAQQQQYVIFRVGISSDPVPASLATLATLHLPLHCNGRHDCFFLKCISGNCYT